MYYPTIYKGKRTKADIMRGENPVTSRFLANNTVEWTLADGVTFVRLHDTDIMMTKGNRISFNSGGWKTVTTKDRLNRFAPAGWQFWSDKGLWMVSTPAGEFQFVDSAEFYLKSGRPVKPSLHRNETVKVKREKKLISAYVAEVRKGFSLNSNGDPWVIPNPKTGLYDRDVVMSWLKDKYVFPTLIWNAMKASGMGNNGAAMFIERASKGASGYDITAQRVRRYLARSLGHAV